MDAQNEKKPLINESDLPKTTTGNAAIGPDSETKELLQKFLEANNSYIISKLNPDSITAQFGGAVKTAKDIVDPGAKSALDKRIEDAMNKNTDDKKNNHDNKEIKDGKPNADQNKKTHKDQRDGQTQKTMSVESSGNPINEFLQDLITAMDELKK